MPAFPPRNRRGNYPALETIAVSIARSIIAERLALGLTRVELAARAHVRLSTLERVETAQGSPSARVIDKLDAALKRVATNRRSTRPAARKRRSA
jgi:ribosome-binding protein aMBF1 (putative translation factor)